MTLDEFKDKAKKKLDSLGLWFNKNGGKLLFWSGVFALTRGVHNGNAAYRKIKEHEKWTEEEAVPKFNHNAEIARNDQARINELEEKVDILMKKALKETEGSAE